MSPKPIFLGRQYKWSPIPENFREPTICVDPSKNIEIEEKNMVKKALNKDIFILSLVKQARQTFKKNILEAF